LLNLFGLTRILITSVYHEQVVREEV